MTAEGEGVIERMRSTTTSEYSNRKQGEKIAQWGPRRTITALVYMVKKEILFCRGEVRRLRRKGEVRGYGFREMF